MTKIGEGKEPVPKLSTQQYQQELDKNTNKFQNALASYQGADAKQKAHLKGVMDQALGLIRSSVAELKGPGIKKHEAKVQKDYKAYMEKDTSQNYSTLAEDIATLSDYSQLG